MSEETILSYLKRCRPEQQVKLQIASQCAPVLKGIKVSNLVTVKNNTWKTVRSMLKGSDIICIPLYLGADQEVLFLYRYGMMQDHIKKKEIRDFLRQYGYDKIEIAFVILRLKCRYHLYVHGELAFPHELGILLGYPIEDVMAFIMHQGRDSLISSYWKVYHNKELAEQIFCRYDEVRQIAMEEILNGYPLRQVAT